MRHVGIDGNLLCGKVTGMGVVVSQILKYWKVADGIQITLFLPYELDEGYMSMLHENCINTCILGEYNYMVWEQLILPRAVKSEKIDVLWCPYNTIPVFCRCKKIVTVHDVIYMSLRLRSAPSLFKKMGLIYRRMIVPIATKKADKIITISNYSKEEICRYFPYCEDKIKIVYNGSSENSLKLSAMQQIDFFSEFGIQKPFFLGFGSLERRKNSMALIEAYDRISDELKSKYQLVLFGFRGYKNSPESIYIQEKQLQNIVVLEYITEEEKNTLYAESDAFIFPSLSEGFGIPVLEAFQNETPVIASNLTAIPEIAGNAAIMIDPSNISSITSAMEIVACDSELVKKLVNEGNVQLKKFNWEFSAKAVWDELMEV